MVLSLSTGTVWALGWPDPSLPPGGKGGNPPTRSAPEIDPGLAVSALAILTGGILLVGDRVRKSRRNREG